MLTLTADSRPLCMTADGCPCFRRWTAKVPLLSQGQKEPLKPVLSSAKNKDPSVTTTHYDPEKRRLFYGLDNGAVRSAPQSLVALIASQGSGPQPTVHGAPARSQTSSPNWVVHAACAGVLLASLRVLGQHQPLRGRTQGARDGHRHAQSVSALGWGKG
jgi:hypothetical protein